MKYAIIALAIPMVLMVIYVSAFAGPNFQKAVILNSINPECKGDPAC